MKPLHLSLLLAFLLAFSACNTDDDDVEPTCTPTDWVGTYRGSINCGASDNNVTVFVTASGADAIKISYTTGNATTEYSEAFVPENCDIDFTASANGIGVDITINLDGSELTLTEVFSGGSGSDCTITATRN